MAITQEYCTFFRLGREPFQISHPDHRLEQVALGEFIFAELRKAGGPRRELFRETAVVAVYSYTRGVCGPVATLCRQALRHAADTRSLVIGAETVVAAAEALGWPPLHASAHGSPAPDVQRAQAARGRDTLGAVKSVALAATLLTLIAVAVGLGARSLLEGRGATQATSDAVASSAEAE